MKKEEWQVFLEKIWSGFVYWRGRSDGCQPVLAIVDGEQETGCLVISQFTIHILTPQSVLQKDFMCKLSEWMRLGPAWVRQASIHVSTEELILVMYLYRCPESLAEWMKFGWYSSVWLCRASGNISYASSLGAAEEDKIAEMAIWEAVWISITPALTNNVTSFYIWSYPGGSKQPSQWQTLVFRHNVCVWHHL